MLVTFVDEGYAYDMERKVYLELDSFDLGQLIAVLPYGAYKQLSPNLRHRIEDAQKQIESERKVVPELATDDPEFF